MENLITNDIKQTIILLNSFANATGDYYYLCDIEAHTITFSYNITEICELSAINTTISMDLDKWRENVYSRDRNKLSASFNKLKAQKTNDYNINFRIKNKNDLQWINSKGKMFISSKSNRAYLLGRLTPLESTMNSANHDLNILKKQLQNCLAIHQKGFLIIFGIDNLKNINLQHGRKFGDSIISDVYKIIKDESSGAYVYRIGGDSFSMICLNQNKNHIQDIYEHIKNRLNDQCTISAGCVSLTKYYVNDENTLLQYAETALYHAKATGKNNLHFFNTSDYENRIKELEIVDELKKNIQNDFKGFKILYQPQVHNNSYEIIGAEALLRYVNDKGNNLPTMQLIKLLEKYDLIYQVGLWVLQQAYRQCLIWRQTIPYLTVSVNMSLGQLLNTNIEDDVLNIINNTSNSDFLTIELTESMELFNYPYLNEIIKSWKKHGIKISIDDFGTGYSSLSRLQHLTIDEIKIDRSFVHNMQDNVYNYKLIKNIVELAKSFQINVCCEGIETIDELRVINSLDVAILQGHLFSKPIDATSFTAQFIRSNNDAFSNYIPESPKTTDSDFEIENLADLVLNSDNDIFYISDIDTYDLYYLNNSGQKLFNCQNYKGKKCYRVLHGLDAPCSFCTNDRLTYDSFYLWEKYNSFCNRNFLLKDKAINLKGKKLRLEIALDITAKEYISQHSQERLTFANKIRYYTETLSNTKNYNDAVNQLLASVGDFYQADRAYLFEPDKLMAHHWNNTFEWCANGVEPQKDNLQHIPPENIKRWIEEFSKNNSIIVLNLDTVKELFYKEWEILHAQNIQRIIAVPLIINNAVIAFIGVDNPRYSIADDTQVRVLACLLISKMKENKLEYRYNALLKESNQDILTRLNIGFWMVKINKHDKSKNELIGNNIVEEIIGYHQNVDPRTFLTHCKCHLGPNELNKINEAFSYIINTERSYVFSFYWLHPAKGKIKILCNGIITEKSNTHLTIKGYCRIKNEDCEE